MVLALLSLALTVAALVAGGVVLARFMRGELDELQRRSTAELQSFRRATRPSSSANGRPRSTGGWPVRLRPSTGGSAISTPRSTGGSNPPSRRRPRSTSASAKVDSAAAQMLDRAKDLSRLEQALRPPKARGGFGELLLENLLRDRLPPSAFAIQHTFYFGRPRGRGSPGWTADLGRLEVPARQLPAARRGAERRRAPVCTRRRSRRDMRNHVDAISSKYIRPEDGTYNFAFMYVPVEAV